MTKIKIHDKVEQGSDKWHELRLGKITASSFYKALGTKAAREKYLHDKGSEIAIGCKSDGEEFVNMHIRRGWECEPIARSKYIADTFTSVEEVGFIESGDYIACSPDGVIGTDGMIEIKVLDSNNYFRQVVEISEKGIKAIAKEHYIQMQFSLFVSGRQWCDYVLYNPKHDEKGNGLYVKRVERDATMQDRISEAVDECIPIMVGYVERYNKVFTAH